MIKNITVSADKLAEMVARESMELLENWFSNRFGDADRSHNKSQIFYCIGDAIKDIGYTVIGVSSRAYRTNSGIMGQTLPDGKFIPLPDDKYPIHHFELMSDTDPEKLFVRGWGYKNRTSTRTKHPVFVCRKNVNNGKDSTPFLTLNRIIINQKGVPVDVLNTDIVELICFIIPPFENGSPWLTEYSPDDSYACFFKPETILKAIKHNDPGISMKQVDRNLKIAKILEFPYEWLLKNADLPMCFTYQMTPDKLQAHVNSIAKREREREDPYQMNDYDPSKYRGAREKLKGRTSLLDLKKEDDE